MTQAAPDHANYNASAKLDAIADFFDDAEQRAAFSSNYMRVDTQ